MWRSKTINLKYALGNLQEQLTCLGDDAPSNTALVVLGHILNQEKAWLLAHPEYHLSQKEQINLDHTINRLVKGIPLPYILGQWDFFNRSFFVTPQVLIPRPETELLVERAIYLAQNLDPLTVIDVGTGSGAIAVSLSAELPQAEIIAVDISFQALLVAKQNAARYHQPHIHFIQSNLLQPFHTPINMICANLPYIPSDKLKGLEVAHYEPRLALDGGLDGLKVIGDLLDQAQRLLTKPGVILLEIEAGIGENALILAKMTFPSSEITLHKDLAGRDRLVEIVQS